MNDISIMRVFIRRLFENAKNKSINYGRLNSIRLSSAEVNKKEQEVKKIEEPQKRNIVVEKFGPVTTLNIDRQSTRNSLDVTTLKEITAALDAFEKDNEAKVLVFNGEGGSFCSGYDIDELGGKGFNDLKDASLRLCRRPLCDKPTIASISGYAVAEGFELALACDLRIVEDTAVLGCLGRRFGVPQSMLGGRRLTSLIGLSQALDLLMTGRLISGIEAHQKGLSVKVTSTGTDFMDVNGQVDVVTTDYCKAFNGLNHCLLISQWCNIALGESVKLAKCLSKFPQNALIMDKLAAVNSQLNPNSEESMRDEALMTSLQGNAIEDIKEGVKKFQAGIGKHGKFYKLTEVPLKDWEIEESYEEVIVNIEPGSEKPK